LCWIALPIFAVLGIFSAKYRKLTIESLECLFKTATFQKCKSGLDDRIKSQITGKLLKYFLLSSDYTKQAIVILTAPSLLFKLRFYVPEMMLKLE